MNVEVPPAEEEEERPEGSRNPEVDELLRRLLVGELELTVDPISGRAMLNNEVRPAPEDRP